MQALFAWAGESIVPPADRIVSGSGVRFGPWTTANLGHGYSAHPAEDADEWCTDADLAETARPPRNTRMASRLYLTELDVLRGAAAQAQLGLYPTLIDELPTVSPIAKRKVIED